MLDIKFIRENADLITEGARKKHIAFDVAALLDADTKRRALTQEVEALRAKQNAANEQISSAAEPSARAALIGDMKALKKDLQDKEAELKKVMESWRALMLAVPNIPDVSVPEGEYDAENRELHTWGEPRAFDFEAKDHVALMSALDMVDFERGAKVAGFRGYFLKNDGLRLSFALWRYAMDALAAEGFTPLLVPSLVRREPLMGTGYLPASEDDLYKTQDGDYLAGTGEVATMGYYMDEIIEKSQLPIRFAAFSPCFRREAGSHGKDTRGLMRVHEFFKVEQVVLSEASHETSVEWHEKLLENAERLVQGLELPYRVVVNCGGDLGLGQVKKYDIEVWVPSEATYRETHSDSYFHDFQTRRFNIRYRDDDGTLRFTHSLNNTALATPRLLIALVENLQESDGSIRVPAPLQSYLGKDRISRAA